MKLEKTISLIKDEISLCKEDWDQMYVTNDVCDKLIYILKTLNTELKEMEAMTTQVEIEKLLINNHFVKVYENIKTYVIAS